MGALDTPAYALARKVYKLIQQGIISTNNYNALYNKPSINGIDLEGALSSEDLQIIDEDSVRALIDDETKEFVKDTNFASKEKAGVIKVNDLYDVNINSNGDIFPSNLSLPQYNSKSSFSFIGKGTLENVLKDRIITKKDGAGDKYLNDKGEYTEVQGGGTVVLDDEMSDTSENGVKNKVIKNYVDTEVDDVRLAKYPNVTIIGSPVINGGQMSGFSANDYARFPFLVDLTNKPFEINFDILTGSNVSNQQNIFDSDFGFAFAIRNSRFVVAMGSTGTSWDIGEAVGTNVVLPNVQYKIKISWDTATYKVELSTNGGKSYVTDITKDSTASLYPTQIYIGVGEDHAQVLNSFSGMIDFTKANLVVDGNITWVGLDVVGLETRLARDVSNIDAAGEEKIREIVGSGTGGTMNVPVGSVIAHMGETAPLGFLVCDGTIYNISQYPKLFGIIGNKFGGDGQTTFAVPDLRGEFLRGAGSNSHENQGSGGTVGEHQNATGHSMVYGNNGTQIHVRSQGYTTPRDPDVVTEQTSLITTVNASKGTSGATNGTWYTSRPTNTSVLFCIKAIPIVGDIGIELTEEHLTGEIYNDKPVYKKVFTNFKCGSTVKTTITLFKATDIDLEDCIKLDGGIYLGVKYYPFSGTSSGAAKVWINFEGEFREWHDYGEYNDAPIRLTLKYTKTTD